jgi:hypothetical protein
MSLCVLFQRMYLIWFSTKHNLAEDHGSCTGGPVFSRPHGSLLFSQERASWSGAQLLTPFHGLSTDFKYSLSISFLFTAMLFACLSILQIL